jgi:hypothetical protein
MDKTVSMNQIKTEKIWLIITMLVIASAFAITILIMSSVALPIGADYFWHMNIARLIAKGDFAAAWNAPMTENLFPYGILLFQSLLSLTVLSGNPMLIGKILDIILMPTTLTLTLLLVYRHGGGAKPAALTGIVLLGGWAFMDGAIQVRPESLDLLLYPVIMMALISLKKKTFIAISILTIYSHGVAALGVIYGLAVNKLRDKQWRKTIITATILITPIIIVSLIYAQGAIHKWTTPTGTQADLFWKQPLIFIPTYSGATLTGLLFLFRRNKTELESLVTWGFIGSLIMLPLWPDRFLQYASLPLAILAGLGIARTKGLKQVLAIGFILFLFMWFYLIWVNISLHGLWWQPS